MTGKIALLPGVYVYGGVTLKKIFMTKDITLFSVYSILSSLIFETPIFIMFLSGRGLSYSEITVLFSIYAFAVIVFEYATGVIADRYTRKGILIFSTVSLILGEVCFIFGYSLYYFLGGIVLIALSTASRSGADTAYLYDKLAESGKIEHFSDILSNLGSLTLIVSAAACIIGSASTAFGIYVPFIGTIIFSLISVLILIAFKEPHAGKSEKSADRIVRDSFKSLIKSRIVIKFVLLSIVIFPCFHILDQLFQPYMKTSGIKIEYFGIFYTMISIFQSAGTKFSGYLNKKYNPGNILFISSIVIILGFLMMSAGITYLVYLIPAVMGIGFGIYYNINNIVMNKHIDSSVRASVLSLQHALTKIVQMAMFGVISLFIDNTSLKNVFLCFSVFLIVCITILYFFFRRGVCTGKQSLEDSI